ncbi:ST1B1-like protein [Mya arenaria]|uniref:ST1B1-like protein n=1 Tax=Mya arenaria TaxID=6604 RepID=A0ABY7DWE8_MYAAR|nr:ST1B1-like protein [Mya arenaria]
MTSNITVQASNGKEYKFIHAGGITLRSEFQSKLPGGDLAKHLENVKNIDVRDDDVYLATYPKSGTHWVWEIVQMLRKGKAEYEKDVKEAAFVDFRATDQLEEIPSPRVLNCHFPVKNTPRQVFEKGTKIIHVQRNPKDVVVSFFHHSTKMAKMKGNEDSVPQTFSEFLQLFTGTYGIYVYCPWTDYDPVREIKKIDLFLETKCEEKLIKDIADACDFQKLKQADAEFRENKFFKSKGPSPMYRKGEVGDWKNTFTVAENEMMDKWLQENFSDTKLEFRYTLK